MYYRYHPTEGRQMVCILGRGRRSLIECLLRQNPLRGIDLFGGYDVLIVPGEYNDFVTVSFRDPYKKDVRISQDIFRRCLYNGELGFSKEEIAYVTVTGGDMVNFEICIPVSDFHYVPRDRNGFLEHANVIIMLVDAPRTGIGDAQREVETLFGYRNMRNVFFLVNNFNILKDEDKTEFFDRLKNQIGSVFTDANGNFQRELYEHRVFLVDLNTSRAARLRESQFYIMNGKQIKRNVDILEDSMTGVPDFENVLNAYLRTQKWNRIGKNTVVE